jgi:methyl-accepting chemotaxis protein-1 (serine sensor receptor)
MPAEYPGLDEDLTKQLEEQYRIYSATLTQMNVCWPGQSGRHVQTECRAEAERDADVYREWREAQASSRQRLQDNESDYKRILWILSRSCCWSLW